MSEAVLIAAAVSTGDRRAFEGLVRMHQQGLRHVARRWTGGDVAWSDDLAQEAFVRAFQGIRTFRGESKFFSWLCRIAYHVFIEHCRKRRSDVEPEVIEDDHGETATSLERGLSLKHDLERALGCLSGPERVAIGLCFHRDLTHDEAASVMEVPLGTLKSHVNRAKEKLRRRLASWSTGTQEKRKGDS